jgi:hypothetical protein
MVELLVAGWVCRKAVDWVAETAEMSVDPPATMTVACLVVSWAETSAAMMAVSTAAESAGDLE